MDLQDVITENLYPALFECFAIVLCGYLAGRLGLVTQQDAVGLGTFVGTFALPSLIFTSLANLDFSSVNWLFLASMLLAKTVIFLTVIALTLFISKPVKLGTAGLFAIFCTQSNDFAIGYPIIKAIYQSSHPEFASYLYLMAPISLIILNPIAFVLMEIGRQRENTVPIEMRPKVECEKLNMVISIVTGVVFNPIVTMTFLGMIGNIVFKQHLPVYIGGLLEIFGNSFSATALFLLGHKMVGQFHKLRGPALVLPAVLIITKLVVLPLSMRASASSLLPESNDTKAMTEYAFLYGTIPAAPAVFVFSNQYKLEVDLIASSMVICTFVSAPLMLVSAEMVGLSKDYHPQMAHFETGVCALSIAASLWTLVVFTATKKYLKQPHLTTMCLVATQLMLAISALCELTIKSEGRWHDFITYLRIFFSYASQLWIASIALILYLAQCRGPSVMSRAAKWLCPLVSIVASVFVAAGEYTNRNGFGSLLYAFSLIVTSVSVVLLVRERRRNSVAFSTLGNNFAEDAGLIRNDPLLDSNGYGAVNAEAEDLTESDTTSCEIGGREGHLGMLLGYAASMIVAISYLGWSAMSKESSGTLVEMEFVHLTLTYGQSLLPCVIFALRPNCIFVPAFNYLRDVWRRYRNQNAAREEILPTAARELDTHIE